VLTFHDETFVAVFGAWWAACLLKPQIAKLVSQFPFMAIEAPSESGKSTGFVACMYSLSGARKPKGTTSPPVFRNIMAGHLNGIVWVDDPNDLNPYAEGLRESTVGGAISKMKMDHSTSKDYPMRSTALISGESLGLSGQKALLDRSIRPDITGINIKERKSLLKEGRSQWDDITTLNKTYPDLTVFAGVFVSKSLGLIDSTEKVVKDMQQQTVSGRHSDSMAVLHAGAWLLEQLAELDTGAISNPVDLWTQQQLVDYDHRANTLTTKMLPEALARLGKPERPMGPDTMRGKVASPVFVTAASDGGEMWFSPKLLSAWWVDLKHGRIVDRTESENAIEDQARDLGLGGKRGGLTDSDSMRARVRFTTSTNCAVYWRVPKELAETIAERSEGAR
jgi:hypothetical protein